jgi:hypothetical protein
MASAAHPMKGENESDLLGRDWKKMVSWADQFSLLLAAISHDGSLMYFRVPAPFLLELLNILTTSLGKLPAIWMARIFYVSCGCLSHYFSLLVATGC